MKGIYALKTHMFFDDRITKTIFKVLGFGGFLVIL